MKPLLILTLLMGMLGQVCCQTPETTLPLEQPISVHITSIDSAYLKQYNIYRFRYGKGQNPRTGQIIALKKDGSLNLGEQEVQLCRVIQFYMDDSTVLRGCGIANSLYFFGEGKSITRGFDFSADADFRTLTLCKD
ncbi:MAG: hypothetical protein AAGI38_22515 [Bacteroidota bacterium]